MADRNNRQVAAANFKTLIAERETDFRDALPRHIPIERFRRVVMTAIQNNPQLLDAPRSELFNAAVKAAQDGLLPDGKEGALICRPKKGGAITVTWQPMIAGIRKKVRNSGEIATWDVQAVYEHDHFEFELGDNPFILHKPTLRGRGDLIAVYSVATLKSGEKSRDVMSIEDVNAIRDRSDAWKAFKAGKIFSTPWSTDPAEMAKKTVARRHSKTRPVSTDLDDLLRRDDELYDLKSAGDAQVAAPPQRRGIGAKLDALASPDGVTIDSETGEVLDDPNKGRAAPDNDAGDNNGDDDLAERAASIANSLDHDPAGIDMKDDAQVVAYADGMDAFDTNVARNKVPGALTGKSKAAWLAGYDYAAATEGDGND